MSERGGDVARFRWRIECGTFRQSLHELWSAAEAQAWCERAFLAPAIVRIIRSNGVGFQRSGGEFNDGGGRSPIEWSPIAVTRERA
jgi:hypothetical protein